MTSLDRIESSNRLACYSIVRAFSSYFILLLLQAHDGLTRPRPRDASSSLLLLLLLLDSPTFSHFHHVIVVVAPELVWFIKPRLTRNEISYSSSTSSFLFQLLHHLLKLTSTLLQQGASSFNCKTLYLKMLDCRSYLQLYSDQTSTFYNHHLHLPLHLLHILTVVHIISFLKERSRT